MIVRLRGADGVALSARTRDGSGPTTVLLHYWGGSARTWDAVLDHLPGRATIALDQRGWGGSAAAPGPYDLRSLAADVLAVAEGLDDWVLVGHSMGGKVAQLVASTRPRGLRGLVLVAPAPPRPAPSVTPDRQRLLAHAYGSAETVTSALDAVLTAGHVDAAHRAAVVVDSLVASPAARDDWPLRGIAEDVTAEVSGIDVPVRVIVGDLDRVEPPEVLRTHLLPSLPGAQLTVVPGVGHLLPLEAPAAVAAEIADIATVTSTAVPTVG